MEDLKALDIMVRPVVAAKRNASIRDVTLQFLNGLYSGMPVTDEEGKVIGVLTEFDILAAVSEGKVLIKTTAEEVMSGDPVTIDVDTPVSDIITIMKEKDIIRLPVTREGRLVGIVARCDILRSLLEPEFVTYM